MCAGAHRKIPLLRLGRAGHTPHVVSEIVDLSPPMLLVVDEDADTLGALERLLRESAAVQIVTARTAHEARAILAENEVAVALFDAGSPELRRFGAAGRAPTVIDFLCKPLVPAVLAHRLSILLELYRSRVARGAHAKVVHDLRGPLHAISVGTGLLDGEPATVRRVTAAIDKMSALIERLSELR